MQNSIRPRGHDLAVLFSSGSRDAYAASAAALGETYTFDSAWDEPRTWVKGEYAYLAPNAASLLLARCNLKHDVVDEADLSDDLLGGLSGAAGTERGPSRGRDHRAHRRLARER